jgi:hypothetical protein
MSVSYLVVQKRLQKRKSSQQNQLSSQDLLTDPLTDPFCRHPEEGSCADPELSAFLKLTPSSSTSGYWQRKFYALSLAPVPDLIACLAVQSP